MLIGEPRYANCWALSQPEATTRMRVPVARLIVDHPGVGAKLLVQRLRNASAQLVRVMQKIAKNRVRPHSATASC